MQRPAILLFWCPLLALSLSHATASDIGFLDLPPEDAQIHGGHATKVGHYMTKVTDWASVDTWLSWEIEIPEAGTAEVTLTQACAEDQGGAEFTVSTGKETLAGTVNVTNDEGTEYQTFTVGELKFAEPGSYTITLKPTSKPGKTVMQFDKLTLRGDFLAHATRQHYALPDPERISLAVVPSDQGIPHNTLSEDEVAEGWELLFDGESNTGWSGYRKAEFPDGWSTNDGMLFFRGDKAATNGDLITINEFEDFELKLEWKLSEKGNSGVLIRASEDKYNIFETAIEMQILDNERHPDGKNLNTSSGACYAVYDSNPEAFKPVGEWNEVHIKVKGTHHEFYLNGIKTADFDTASEEWHRLSRLSKFHRWPGFAKNPRGHIGLQDHGDPAWFRNLKIKRL